ncbi:MAG: class I SAM-dependent DNA methyltransferase [Olsenella sp.]|nr:class I SAM-dependent DNA methyltransferase [Olsenella sp.]
MDWNDVLPAQACSFCYGNPPFYGSSMCTARQKQEIVDLFTRDGTEKVKLANSLDYVSGWYYKACQMMMENDRIRAAFVSTNSITQGEQVHPIWHTLFERFDIHIDFAWRTFVWDNEATDKAHVHCVIVGFSRTWGGERVIYDGGEARVAKSISPYLIEAEPVIPESRKRPLCDVPALAYGNKPTDGGNLILTDEEKEELLAKEPQAAPLIREYIGAKEYLSGKTRWCLWMLGTDRGLVESCPEVRERVEAVRAFRVASSAKDTRKRAEAPWEFFRTPVHDVPYMAVPRTSSQRRRYLPIGWFGSDTVPSDATSVIPNATHYQFGVLESQFHSAWMRVVAGRLKSDYRYSGDVVYNNFVWPDATPEQREFIESCAQTILDVRTNYPGESLATLYDPDKMPDDLLDAHKALDAAVEAAYGVDFDGDEEKIVAHLFKLYAEKTAK